MIRLGKTEHYVFALTLGNDTMVGKWKKKNKYIANKNICLRYTVDYLEIINYQQFEYTHLIRADES